MFYEKAIAAWRDATDMGHIALVKRYFEAVSGFSKPKVISRSPSLPNFLQSLGFFGNDPFYVVLGERNRD